MDKFLGAIIMPAIDRKSQIIPRSYSKLEGFPPSIMPLKFLDSSGEGHGSTRTHLWGTRATTGRKGGSQRALHLGLPPELGSQG